MVLVLFGVCKKNCRILALHCTYSSPINLSLRYNSTVLSHRPDFCNSTVLSHRPDFWPAAHVMGHKNIYLSIYIYIYNFDVAMWLLSLLCRINTLQATSLC